MQSTLDFSHYLKGAGSGLLHLDLAVEGINCAGCMAKIERNLSKIPDVTLARVNLTDRRLAVEWKEGAVDPAIFVDRLKELGYGPIRSSAPKRRRKKQAAPVHCCAGLASRLSPR
jgi:P-type Cu2+ transporter